MTASVADVVVAALARAGVARIFTTTVDGPLTGAAAPAGLVLVRAAGEAAACVMAAVTGDLSGTPGAVTIGDADGIQRGADALAAALAERSPLVCLGPPAPGLSPVVKAVVDAGAASAGHWIAHAIHLALTSPRGPVYVSASEGWATPALPVATVVRPAGRPAPDAAALDRAAAVIRDAARPVVVVGVDGRDDAAGSWLRAFAESVPAPVLATWKAKGALSDPHPLSFGVLGASAPAASVLERADLVVALGLDGFERDALDARVPVVDLGPTADLDRSPRAAAAVVADVGTILAELAPRLSDTRGDWDVAELDRWKRRLDVRDPSVSRALVRLVAFVREAMPAGTVATFESTLRDAATAWDCVSPGDLHVLARSRLGGFAVPAAIAAALARPSDVALAFTDRTNLAESRAELATAARLGAPIGVVVVDADVSQGTLALALSRLLAERRSVVIDAAGTVSTPPV